MKTLKQLREEYDAKYMPEKSDAMMLEAIGNPNPKNTQNPANYKVKSPFDVPSTINMPSMLMFRRITYRRYPDNQTVALYYSAAVDKYLSIPFGPTGNLNLSEATIYDTLEDLEEGVGWETTKGAVKGAALGAAKGFFRGAAAAAEPGMAIGAVVGGISGAIKGGKKAYNDSIQKEDNDPCWKGYEAYGTKKKNGKTVPNCVPVDEDWQSVNRKDKTDGLSQAAVNAYRRENPGSKLKTAVTEKNPSGKRAARRKSFCSRMGGMKKRLTSAKTARDPNSRINKALRRWNCEEDFKLKLAEMRMLQNEGIVGDTIEKGRKWAQDKVKDSEAFKIAKEVGHHLPGYKDAVDAKKKWAAGDKWGAVKSAGKNIAKAAATGAGVAAAAGLAIKSAVSGGGDEKGSSDSSDPNVKHLSTDVRKAQSKVYSPSFKGNDSGNDSPIDKARHRTILRKEYEASKKQVDENKIADIRAMIDSGDTLHEMLINGRTVTLNTSMAKRILEVYDSVNAKNKKVVESMLNENLESFKKLLQFSIKA